VRCRNTDKGGQDGYVKGLASNAETALEAELRVAVITDIHGNLPALESTLAAIDTIGVDQVYCGGDLVGYGPSPNEVCALLAERDIPTIYGNYDHAIARDLDDCGCAYRDEHDRKLGERSIAWTLANTSRESKEYMRVLPFDLRFQVGTRRVLLVHGSPRKVNQYLFEDTPDSVFERLARQSDADVLVFGHTHKPWIREIAGVLFVNCGSVGKPKDGDARSSFALLELAGDNVVASIERVPYDTERVARDVAAAGLPAEYGDKLLSAT
jgi:putative phosphoesterase